MTILQFPTKKSTLQKITVNLQVETLEDGSVWWRRVEDIKTGEYGEWVKLEGEGWILKNKLKALENKG